jgi:phosphoribosylformimino-5-aminoimidazole carboxamide ribotide isomerase
MNRCRIVPAIDLMHGRCVRLQMGDFSLSEIVGDDPIAVARAFSDAGFSRLHIVDLDGARVGTPQHLELVREIAEASKLSIDVSGGLRTTGDVERALSCGASAVMVGSAAVLNPELVRSWFARFGSSAVILGLDVLNGEVRVKGWSEGSAVSIAQVLAQFRGSGLSRVMSTDIARDGMMNGPAIDLYRHLVTEYPEIEFIASGGVSKDEDIMQLAATGVTEVIVGKALYSGALNLERLGEFVW